MRRHRAVVFCCLLVVAASLLVRASSAFGQTVARPDPSIGKIADPAVLAEIAKRTNTCGSVEVRAGTSRDRGSWRSTSTQVRNCDCVAAIGNLHLDDQALFLAILRTHPDKECRWMAIMRLTDQGALTEIAKQTNACDVIGQRTEQRFESIANKTVLKMDRTEEIRVCASAVAIQNPRLDDQTLLADIARTHPDREAREAAIAKLSDQSVIAEIADKDPARDVREAAVKNLSDQNALASLAQNDSESDVRLAAIERLTNQVALGSIAKNDTTFWVRAAAIKRLTDQGILADYAKNAIAKDAVGGEVTAAIQRLTDQAALVDVAKNARDSVVRGEAVQKVTDQNVLAEIAKMDPDRWVRTRTVEKLTDQALLTEIGKKDRDGSVREAAKERLRELRKIMAK